MAPQKIVTSSNHPKNREIPRNLSEKHFAKSFHVPTQLDGDGAADAVLDEITNCQIKKRKRNLPLKFVINLQFQVLKREI